MKKEDTVYIDILQDLARKGRGRIFFAQEYYDRWPDSTVRYTLSDLARDGQIARLARGVFCYPRLTENGTKMILPGIDTIAHAIADHTHVRIIPYGDQAAYLVGLTSIQISSGTYLTDGAPRRIHLSHGRTIEFRHTSEMRVFAFFDRRLQMLSNAIRSLKKKNINSNDREVIRWILNSVSAKDFSHDIALCPEWVRDTLSELLTSGFVKKVNWKGLQREHR